MKDDVKREIVNIDENFGDQTSNGPWEFEGEVYTKVDQSEKFGDGREVTVVVQRESDKKYFVFTWVWFPSAGDYEFDDRLKEVFPVITTKWN